ncbi:MAG: metallophosphoesterase [Bacteroidetes bacterium]|nr:metallophosphoesterase [Bacteroidota bacterium]
MKRTIVVGDIHGCYHELLTLLEKTGLRDEDLLISVGDLVDRGNTSKEVWQYFMDRPNTITLMGNHERKHLQGIHNYAQEIVKIQMGEQYPHFLAWAMTLPYYFETDDAIIVHAAMEHDLPLHVQRQDVLSGTTAGERYLEKKYAGQGVTKDKLCQTTTETECKTTTDTAGQTTTETEHKTTTDTTGQTTIETECKTTTDTAGQTGRHTGVTTSAYWTDHYTGTKPVIYGHSVTGHLPRIVNNTYGIDTGACHGGYLTAIELPGFIIHQVKVEKDHWKEQQAQWQIPVLESKDWDNMEISAIQKELDRLAYKESPAIKDYLNNKRSYLTDLDASLPTLKAQLDLFASAHSERLHEYPFKTFLYKSRSGNLSVTDLRKSLHTPAKIKQLQHLLSDSLLVSRSDGQ